MDIYWMDIFLLFIRKSCGTLYKILQIKIFHLFMVLEKGSNSVVQILLSLFGILRVMLFYFLNGGKKKIIITPNTLGFGPRSIMRKCSFPGGSYKESIDKLVVSHVSYRGFIISLCITAICCIVEGQ